MRVTEKIVFHPSEYKKIACMVLAMCGLAHMRRREMRQRWLPKDIPDDKLHWLVDHPAFGYLYENTLIFGLAYLYAKFVPKISQTNPWRTFTIMLCSFPILVDPSLVMEKLSATFLYSHVPYFSPVAPRQDIKTLVKEYMQCNLLVTIVAAVFQSAVSMTYSKEKFEQLILKPAPLRLVPLLLKLAYCRIVVDIVFYIAHRAMHEYPNFYNTVHRMHHEHQTPRSQTNLHFTFLDQFIEAALPVFVAVGSLILMGKAPNRMEQPFLALPILYFETASHTGKEIPIVTWFPPLSPLINMFTGIDQRLIEFHTRHHQLYRCNYSISPWVDKLMGTYRIDLPEHYNSVNAAEKQ